MPPKPSDKCGKCCEHVHLSELTKELDRGDGVCKHYDSKTKLCAIYETRPLICQVESMYRLYYSKEYSWQEFCALNLKVCEELKNKN
ncbi:YkgJ family cysteine cluster protein [Helicobacter cetorum]|uniref:YkgJ family cysteine cluster protein n=1 Tax=Helicobacter cetorum TaxID=138563 RepID=UPI000CF0583C|nr:YkgJ family cysteine cluster protein [Helicobacter cetorum]